MANTTKAIQPWEDDPSQPPTAGQLRAGSQSQTTMTSREIAELTGKEHKHVRRDISDMLAELKEPEEGYVQVWTDPQNKREYEEYRLDWELTMTLLTGYSAVMRRTVVRRWAELEAATKPLNPLEHVDPSRIVYFGEEHDLSIAGLYYAALEAKLLGKKAVAKKFGVQVGFVEAIMRVPDREVRAWGQKATKEGLSRLKEATRVKRISAETTAQHALPA